MKAIDASARTVSEVLKGKLYGIDCYQLEYGWQRKHAKLLIAGLTAHFLQSYRPSHPRGNGLPKTAPSVILAIRE